MSKANTEGGRSDGKSVEKAPNDAAALNGRGLLTELKNSKSDRRYTASDRANSKIWKRIGGVRPLTSGGGQPERRAFTNVLR